jgi:hypothetical protein
MTDLAALRASCQELAARLQGPPDWERLRSVYLDLAPVVGELQGAVSEYERTHSEAEEGRRAEAALGELKESFRQVGLNIRLASPAALQVGLQTALRSAAETLDWLEGHEPPGP